MNKQDKEKARELAIQSTKDIDDNGKEVYNAFVEAALQEMAAWKEQQMIEKGIEFIKNNLEDTQVLDDYRDIMVRGVQSSYTSIDELIKSFKKYMEEN